MKDNKFVALTYKACPCCGKKDEEQSEILLHKRFGDLSSVDKQVTGFGTFCTDCQEITTKAVACVVVDQSKRSDMSNPYRTGNIFGLSEDWCKRALSDEMCAQVLKKRMFYMDYKDALELELPVNYLPN